MGYIYVLVEDLPAEQAHVKIGYSTNVESLRGRLSTHCGSNARFVPYLMFCGSRGDEAAIHKHFADMRVNNKAREIYHLKQPLREYLETLGTKWFIAADVDELDAPSFTSHEGSESALPGEMPIEQRRSVSLFDPKVGPLLAPLPLTDRRPQDSNEWYTPACYVEAARRTMGSIDLDPATSHAANRTSVRAPRWYTVQDDGLDPSNPWKGNVWLNPPYGGEQTAFVNRCLEEYLIGNVTAAVLCLNGNQAMAGTKWFQPLFEHAICFSGRIKFIGGHNKLDQEDPMNNPMNTTCFVYIGKDELAFRREFAEFGPIMAPLREAVAS